MNLTAEEIEALTHTCTHKIYKRVHGPVDNMWWLISNIMHAHKQSKYTRTLLAAATNPIGFGLVGTIHLIDDHMKQNEL
jgi:hypothetical protein